MITVISLELASWTIGKVRVGTKQGRRFNDESTSDRGDCGVTCNEHHADRKRRISPLCPETRWRTACNGSGLTIRGAAHMLAMMASVIHVHERIAASAQELFQAALLPAHPSTTSLADISVLRSSLQFDATRSVCCILSFSDVTLRNTPNG
jgi:hypothetical protein